MAVEAYGLTQGQGPEWLAITSLGSELDPAQPAVPARRSPVARTAPAPVRATFGADTEPQTAQLLDPKGTPSTNACADLDLDLDDAPVRAGATTAPAPLPPAVPTPAASMAPAVGSQCCVAAAATFAVAARILVPPPAVRSERMRAARLRPRSRPCTAVRVAPAAPAPRRPHNRSRLPARLGTSRPIDFDMNALSVDPDSRPAAT